MSLAINTTTPEGIVLAADSRQSYRNKKGMARIGSDSVNKIFQINNRIGIAVTGLAFIPEEGVPKNISKFIEEFKRKVDTADFNVKDVAEKLHYLFDKKYDWEKDLKQLAIQIENSLKGQGYEILEIKPEKYFVKFRFKDSKGNTKEGLNSVNRIEILIAGYNKDGSHNAYICYIPGEIEKKQDSEEEKKEYGTSWIGQIDVVARIILGRDPRTFNVPFIQKLIKDKTLTEKELLDQLNGLQYNISWGTMTLQNAIDFCTLAIQTTAAIQRFSDGIVADPGDMPGVGGPVDVAVITPNKGFVWVNKKRLKVGDKEVDLESFPDLPKFKPSTKRKKK